MCKTASLDQGMQTGLLTFLFHYNPMAKRAFALHVRVRACNGAGLGTELGAKWCSKTPHQYNMDAARSHSS